FSGWRRWLLNRNASARGAQRRGCRPYRPLVEDLEARNLLTFGPGTNFLVGTNPFDVTSADFNRDGKPDLATADEISNTVSVLLGNGDGQFQTAQPLQVGLNPFAVVAGDFNGDGAADIAAGNVFSNTVSLLLGNGDGSFKLQQTFATNLYPVSILGG